MKYSAASFLDMGKQTMNYKLRVVFQQRLLASLFLLLRRISLLTFIALVTFGGANRVFGQTGITLWGDIKVDERNAQGSLTGSITVILYQLGGATIVGRQTVPANGRYRFNNVRPAEYELAVEVQTAEIARIHLSVGGRPGSDFQQDLEFEWKGNNSLPNKPGTVSAADVYKRSAANELLFKKAQQAMDKKNYEEGITLFKQIVDGDKQDFQAWTELGTAYLMTEKKSEAEKAYERAVEMHPTFAIALLNLGRVRVAQKKYEEGIATLTRLLELQPESPDGNYFLGEAYLQIKKGSKAVPYLEKAAQVGRPEAYLRLATLYDAAGLKDRAAHEYEEYLKKQPNDPMRKKLEKYIADNKKP
jgi:cytochrome c-type biogenesis protein CcmH/NrfG